MGFATLECQEYDFCCDSCGDWTILHTGDLAEGVYVHDIRSAFKAAKYYKCNYQGKDAVLCDKCFRGENDGKKETM